MKRTISLAAVIGVLLLGASMMFAQQPAVNTPTHYWAPQYFNSAIYYGQDSAQQLPALITGTATNAQALVSFGVVFKSAPMVFLSWKETQAVDSGTNELWAVSISKTNFVPKTTMVAGGAYTNINWIAIGPLF